MRTSDLETIITCQVHFFFLIDQSARFYKNEEGKQIILYDLLLQSLNENVWEKSRILQQFPWHTSLFTVIKHSLDCALPLKQNNFLCYYNHINSYALNLYFPWFLWECWLIELEKEFAFTKEISSNILSVPVYRELMEFIKNPEILSYMSSVRS